MPDAVKIEDATEAAIARAAALLRDGALVAFPTETVYGLGADATSDAAIERLYAAKGRPAYNPLIIHLPDLDAVETVARVEGAARATLEALAAGFWPGPLTVVLPLRAGAVSARATAGLDTVAVRLPAHPVARALLRATGRPVAAPSANPSGRLSPTSAADVAAGLGDRVALILDGGPCAVGVESAIVDLTGAAPRLLRPGGVPVEAVQAVLGVALADDAVVDDATPSAPGQLTSHYAPGARLRLGATDVRPGEAWLGFGPDPAGAAQAPARETLSASGDVAEAATRLFAALRRLDAALAATGAADPRIAVAPVPERGLGRAVNDRLRRAAAPRPGEA